MENIKDKTAIIGVGETVYSRNSDKSQLVLTLEAALAAIEDAGLTPRDIDGVIPYALGGVVAEDFITNFAIEDLRYSAVIPMGGASAVAALQSAAMAVATGTANNVLLTLGRSSVATARAAQRINQMPQFQVVREFEMPLGTNAPAQFYAPMARRHMELYGTTSEQMGHVAITCRQHAQMHDNAMMRKPMTLDDHQQSRMIADPFRLFDCCLESAGAAAVVVSASDRAADAPHLPVYLTSVVEGHPESPSAITQRQDMTQLGLAKAAPKAFAIAGIKPSDIDVAEIYDCFTYTVICQLEDLGFCAKGDGGPFVMDGHIALGGALPVNTHGGLLSQAHIAGMNHIVELVCQLRGDAGRRQVEAAEIGLVTGYGDLGDGSIAIMRR